MSIRHLASVVITLLFPVTAHAQFTTVINVPPDTPPSIIGSDTQLNIRDGGELNTPLQLGAEDGSSTNIEVNVTGGFFQPSEFNAFGGTINLSNGSLAGTINVFQNTTLNMTGGRLRHGFSPGAASTVNISNGIIGDDFFADNGSNVMISGGTFGEEFTAGPGSNVHISGGTFDDEIAARDGSILTITGGNLGDDLLADFGSIVNVTGGVFGTEFTAAGTAIVNISGGTFGDIFEPRGGTINITGGTFQGIFNSIGSSDITISGGDFQGPFRTLSNATITLLGTQFLINDLPIPGLENFGDSIILNQRSGTLSATLADGRQRDFTFGDHDLGFDDFDPQSTLRLTITRPIPEPTSLMTLTLLAATLVSRVRIRQ